MEHRTEPPTVLVVDDEPEIVELFSIWLSDTYRVRTATSGTEALERFDSAVDVVLLDRNMPDMSGDTVLEAIRTVDDHCRNVMVTGETPDVDVIELTFDDYLLKPVDRAELESTVDRVMKRATYGRLQDECYTLASRLAVLETHLPSSDLAESEEYQRLAARLDALRAELDTLTADFQEWEYWAEFDRYGATGD